MSSLSPVVYLVDDDPSVLRALRRLLNVEGFDTRAFSTPKSFLEQHDPAALGCIVLDVAMPEVNGVELHAILTGSRRVQPVIFISGNSDIPISVSAMKGGAVDFLTKPVSGETLVGAVRSAIKKDEAARQERAVAHDVEKRLASLTPRERAVFEQVVVGKLNKQIAGDLGIVEKTVKVHRARMMRKMGVRTLAELARIAERSRPSPYPSPADNHAKQ